MDLGENVWKALKKIILEKNLVDEVSGSITLQEVRECLNLSYFIQNSQNCAANRETTANKKLILTGIYVFEEGLLSIEMIYKGLSSYEL